MIKYLGKEFKIGDKVSFYGDIGEIMSTTDNIINPVRVNFTTENDASYNVNFTINGQSRGTNGLVDLLHVEDKDSVITFEEWCDKYLDMDDAWKDLRVCYEMDLKLTKKLEKALEFLDSYGEYGHFVSDPKAARHLAKELKND